MSKQNWKDLVEEVAGEEKEPVVYDFGERQFPEPVNQDGTGIYDDALIGGESGE